jgi:hypothetical protein
MAQDHIPTQGTPTLRPPTIVPLPNDPSSDQPSSSSSSEGETPAFELKQRIIAGLRGANAPAQDSTAASKNGWEYKKSIPTMVLYDEKGLRLYDAITEDAPEYYLFGAELGLFKEHGAEIARAMGFPQPFNAHQGNGQQGSDEQDTPEHGQSRGEKVDEKWGDVTVGRWNNGVNGEHNDSPLGPRNGQSAHADHLELSVENKQKVERGWDIVELGAG